MLICDHHWSSQFDIRSPIVGGDYDNGPPNGIYCLHLYYTPIHLWWDVGACFCDFYLRGTDDWIRLCIVLVGGQLYNALWVGVIFAGISAMVNRYEPSFTTMNVGACDYFRFDPLDFRYAFVGDWVNNGFMCGCSGLTLMHSHMYRNYHAGACDVFGWSNDDMFHAFIVGGCYAQENVDRRGVGFLLLGRSTLMRVGSGFGA